MCHPRRLGHHHHGEFEDRHLRASGTAEFVFHDGEQEVASDGAPAGGRFARRWRLGFAYGGWHEAVA